MPKKTKGAAAGGGGGISASERAEIELQAQTGPWDADFHKKHRKLGRDLAREKLAELGEGELYTDEEFGPEHFFGGTDKEGESSPYEWKRFFSTIERSYMIVGGIDEGDLRQGHLGDCYFVSSVATVAAAGMAQNLIATGVEEGRRGIVCLRFFHSGGWKFVFVDDRVPMRKGSPVMMRSTEKREAWPSMLEKGFAKLCGGYQILKSGDSRDVMFFLTGYPTESFLTKDEGEEGSFARIKAAADNGALMCCGSKNSKYTKGTGIAPIHYYSLLRVVSTPEVDLLVIRNPWASGEWKGAYSDGDKEHWTEELKTLVGHDPEKSGNDGVFVMSKKDFKSVFFNVSLCYPPSPHHYVYTSTLTHDPPNPSDKHDATSMTQFPIHVTSETATIRVGIMSTINRLRSDEGASVIVSLDRRETGARVDKDNYSTALHITHLSSGAFSNSSEFKCKVTEKPRTLIVSPQKTTEPTLVFLIVISDQPLQGQSPPTLSSW